MSAADLQFVSEDLAIGARFATEAIPELVARHHLSRVVDLRLEACDDARALTASGIKFLHLPTPDTRPIADHHLREGIAFVDDGRARGERTLVHCEYGIGRSALLVLSVLVGRGDSPVIALQRVKAVREIVAPSRDQLESFLSFAAACRAAHQRDWTIPTVDEMGTIAWRHLWERRDQGGTLASEGAKARPG